MRTNRPHHHRSMLLLTGLFSLALLHAQPLRLSVGDVLHRAATDNAAVKAQLANGESAAAQVDVSRSGLFPSLDANGSYAYVDPIAHILFPTGPGQFQDFAFQPRNNYDANMRLTYTLFDFGQRNAGVDIARVGEQLSDHQLDQVRNDLALRAVQVYYSTLGVQEGINVQKKLIASLDENLRRVEVRIQQESATGYDRLTTQSRRSEAERDMIRLEAQRDRQLAMLRQLTGLAPGTAIELTNDSSAVNVLAIDTNAWRNRPDHQLAADRVQQATLNVQLNQHRGMPSLGVFAQGGVKNGYQPDLNENVANWAAGANLSVPIFHGNKKVSMVEQARAELKQAEFQQQATDERIQAEIDQARTALNSAQRELETTNTLVQQAEETAKRARVRYENGLANALELLDAEVANSRAQLAQLQARYGLAMAAYGVPFAAGTPIYH